MGVTCGFHTHTVVGQFAMVLQKGCSVSHVSSAGSHTALLPEPT